MSTSTETPTSPTTEVPHHYTTQAIVVNASAGAGPSNIDQNDGHSASTNVTVSAMSSTATKTFNNSIYQSSSFPESYKLSLDANGAVDIHSTSNNTPTNFNSKINKKSSANNNISKKNHREYFNSSGGSNNSSCINKQHAMQLQQYHKQADNALVTPSSSTSSSPVSLSGTLSGGASTSAAVHHHLNNHEISFQQQQQPTNTHQQHHQVGRPTSSSPSEKINLRLILVSGKTKEFLFNPTDSAGDIAQTVFDNWPDDWANEAVSKAEILRLIYQGRFLHCNVTLGALGLPLGKTTVMHLVPRDNLPEPNSQDQRQKSKGGSSRCCSTPCCIL